MNEFEKMIGEHKKLLTERGYTEAKLNNGDQPGALASRFEMQFLKYYFDASTTGKTKMFILEATGRYNYGTDKVVFNFLYAYDPEKKQLDLKGFGARMGNQSEDILLQEKELLPAVEHVYTVLKEKTQIEKALNIQQQPNKGQGKKL